MPAVPRPLPVRTWQVWNEANFFYFAYPVSPSRYAKLLKLTYQEIKADDPIAKVILSGLFGDPDQGPKRAWTRPSSSPPSTACRGSRATSTGSPCTPTPSTSKTSKN